MKIVVCGGGTAGHITPILAVIDALYKLQPAAEILFIGTGSELEKRLLKGSKVHYEIITAGKFRRYKRGLLKEITDVKLLAQNSSDLIRSLRGYKRSKKILKKFKPDVVFTKGGYVTVPVGMAASRLKLPLVIHESDAIFGLSTRLLAPKAKIVATGFPKESFNDSKEQDKFVFTGNPVRQELLIGSRSKAHTTFGFDTSRPVLLILGGSQGAAVLNQTIFGALEVLLKKYDVIHHTGRQGIEEARVKAHQLPVDLQAAYRPYEFLQSELGDALFISSLAIIRPSASSVAEIAAHSIPTIVVPSPHSSNGHQQANAKVLQAAGAVRVLNQTGLTSLGLCAQIEKILQNKKTTQYLGRNIHSFWQPNAAGSIAQNIIRATKQQDDV